MYKKLVAEAIAKHIILSSVLLLLSVGCTKEGLPNTEDDTPGIRIDLQVADPLPNAGEEVQAIPLRSLSGNIRSGQITTRAASPTPSDAESVISNAYVLFYASGADDEAQPATFQSATGLSSLAGCSLELENTLLTGLKAGNYDIYVLANLPSSTTPPSQSTTLGDLKNLNEKQFDRTTDNPGISFFGSGLFAYDQGNRQTFRINIYRTVARLDISVNGLSSGQTATVRIVDQAATTLYFHPGGSAAPVKYWTSTAELTESSNTYQIYVYPNYTGGDEYGKARLYLSVLNSDGSVAKVYEPVVLNSGTIERNKIYEITCAL